MHRHGAQGIEHRARQQKDGATGRKKEEVRQTGIMEYWNSEKNLKFQNLKILRV